MSNPVHTLFASCPRGVEPLLVHELQTLGAHQAVERKGGVSFQGDLATTYRSCLWSRLASRILMPLAHFELSDTEQLYAAAHGLDWADIFSNEARFAVSVAGRSPSITNTHFAGLKIKDAIVDRFRESTGKRPSVDTDRPDIRVHLHLDKSHANISLDLSGESLHRRGYRLSGHEAPLKENLAAALLLRCGWPAISQAGGGLLDPLCGSGTLVIEAALMAADIAPGIAREAFGFEAWLDHKPLLWRELRAEAIERRNSGLAADLPPMQGSDLNPAAIRAAEDNARRAGIRQKVQFVVMEASSVRPFGPVPGLIVTNPPYGERLGQESELIKLYSLLGGNLKQHFGGWKAGIFTGRPDLGPRLGMRARTTHSFYNGALPCKLLSFDIPAPHAQTIDSGVEGGGEDFANRLRKNLKHLQRWARRADVSNYRLYDADLPDYAVAVDLYQSESLHLHIQEYAPPKEIDPVRAERRLREALMQAQQVLEVPATHLHYKLRRRQKGSAQYEKQDDRGRFHLVTEHGVKLWVNFDDYLDTGLFLDHRPLRLRLQREAKGKRFLNLFCYTGAATAHAVSGGARRSLSLDLSNTYLDWAARNLAANGFSGEFFPRAPSIMPKAAHALVRADCMDWLKEQARVSSPMQFDLIFCDPPTFSTSKKMTDTLDIQRDHVEMIRNSCRLLAGGGVLYFSTNRRGFKLDQESLSGLHIEDLTSQTLDEDFRRPPPAHRCWKIQAR